MRDIAGFVIDPLSPLSSPHKPRTLTMDRPLFRGHPIQSVAAGECRLVSFDVLRKNTPDIVGFIAMNIATGAAVCAYLVMRVLPASIRALVVVYPV